MLSKVFQAAICAAFLGLINLAEATDETWYVTADAGIGFLGKQDFVYSAPGVTGTGEADFDASIAAGGTLGYRINPRWRAEAELMYRRNEQSDFTLPGLGSFTEGDFASLSIGFSALYDFNLFSSPDISSYVGAGVVFLQEIDIDFETVAGVETSFETDDIAFQLQLGARYDLGKHWFLSTGVRYLVASDVEMALPADTTQTVTSDYTPLTVSLGIGWKF